MFGVFGKTTSRIELLSMVKKQSNLLGKNTVDEQDVSDVESDHCFWHDVMNLYFISGRESRRQDDDLLFFVRKMSLDGYVFVDNMDDDSPYFVRRWAPKLENLIDEKKVGVDWRRSFYLNLIAHTSFSVTVAICSHQALRNHQSGQETSLSPIYKVVKTVYASPSRVDFHLDSRKEDETTPAYPDICFAIDDFESTFDAVVLTDKDHCYCVLLNAHGGAAFPNLKAPQDCSSSDYSPLKVRCDAVKAKKTKITLFSGFVSYQIVQEAYDATKSGFGSLLSLGHYSGKANRLYLKGPGGRGEVEVAVSGVADQSIDGSTPHTPGQFSKRGFGFGDIVHTAANVAKHAFAAAATNRSSDDEMLPLKCCLMSVSLPWEHIAHDLLFKGSSACL